jgi:hypothetical protein
MADRLRSASDVVLNRFQETSNTGSLTIIFKHILFSCVNSSSCQQPCRERRDLLVLCNAEFAPIQIWV